MIAFCLEISHGEFNANGFRIRHFWKKSVVLSTIICLSWQWSKLSANWGQFHKITIAMIAFCLEISYFIAIQCQWLPRAELALYRKKKKNRVQAKKISIRLLWGSLSISNRRIPTIFWNSFSFSWLTYVSFSVIIVLLRDQLFHRISMRTAPARRICALSQRNIVQGKKTSLKYFVNIK